MKVMIKSATEVRDQMILEKGNDVVLPSKQKAPKRWEPKDSKSDLKSKKKNKKHRAKLGFDKVSGNKSPDHVASAKKPEQVRSDNTSSHDVKGKEECGAT
jgi:hypothetical protein